MSHRHSQLLEDNRCLLIVEYPLGAILVFLERLSSLNGAVSRRKFKRQFHRAKLGPTIVMTFDESQRMLAVCAADKVMISFLIPENSG
jgi:hypothetical protein